MNNRNKIEFAACAKDKQQPAPWDQTPQPLYEDLIFTEDLNGRQLKLEPGPNWIRIVPALVGSDSWMTPVHVIKMKHGRFADPRTFRKGGMSAFSHAYRWFAANAPGKLFNRKNPNGHRLLSDSQGACWCLREDKDGKVEARLFLGSSYNGSKTGLTGLGFRLWEKVSKTDPEVDVVLDPIHPVHGALVCIEMNRVPASRYPTYQVRVGRQESPIQGLLDRMEASEFDLLRPIEKTIRELSEEEQWEHLARVVGDKDATDIRSSIA